MGDDLPFLQHLWYRLVKPTLTLPAPKEVRLVDWRLGLGLRFLQVGILGGVLYGLVVNQNYLLGEVPTGLATVSAEMTPGLRNNTFCQDLRKYDYMFDEETKYKMMGCTSGTKSELVQEALGGVFLTTSTERTLLVRVDAPNATQDVCRGIFPTKGSCMPAPEFAYVVSGGDAGGMTGSQKAVTWEPADVRGDMYTEGSHGTCRCSVRKLSMATGVDETMLGLNHMYSTVFSGSGAGANTVAIIKVDGKEEEKFRFEKGEPVEAPLWQWLEWAEVSLDTPMNQEPNRQWVADDIIAQAEEINADGGYFDSEKHVVNNLQGFHGSLNGEFPTPRLTGMLLKVLLEYKNYNMHLPPEQRQVYNGLADTVCIIRITPYMLWTKGTQEVVYLGPGNDYRQVTSEQERWGVRMTFSAGGMMYVMDLNYVLSILVDALVMLNLAGTVMVLAARFTLGDKSRFYNDMIIEQVNATAEYARFAAKAMVASAVFDIIDNDRSGEIGKPEIFSRLRRVTMTQGVSIEATASLVEFMMEVADTGEEDAEDDIPKGDAGAAPEKKEAAAKRESIVAGGGEGDGKEKKQRRKSSIYELSLNTQEAKVERRSRQSILDLEKGEEEEGDRGSLNREEWVNIFTGPPCNLDSCIALVNRKNSQGRYVIPEAERVQLKQIDTDLKRQIENEREEALAAERMSISDMMDPQAVREAAQEAQATCRRQVHQIEKLEKELARNAKLLEKLRKLENLDMQQIPAEMQEEGWSWLKYLFNIDTEDQSNGNSNGNGSGAAPRPRKHENGNSNRGVSERNPIYDYDYDRRKGAKSSKSKKSHKSRDDDYYRDDYYSDDDSYYRGDKGRDKGGRRR